MQKIINSKFLQILPFIFFLGPLFLELYFIFLLLINIKNINIKSLEIDKIFIFIIFFFLSILITSIVTEHHISTLKGISYIRFFLYIVLLSQIIDLSEKNLEKFCISAAVVCLILVLFNLFQVITDYGTDDLRTTIPMRNEPISGSFISYFSLFIFSFIVWKYNNKKIKLFKTILLITILLFGCIVSGERISSITMILVTFTFLFLKSKKLLLIVLITAITTSLIISSFFKFERSEFIFKRFSSFVMIVRNFDDSIWADHFIAAKKTWKNEIILGNGVKSFRIECKNYNKEIKYPCASHPHNIYLEILSEIGLLGLVTFIIMFSAILTTNIKTIFYNKQYNSLHNYILITITLYFLINYFPIKSFGSFFNNYNSFGFWLLVFLSLNIKKKINE